MARNSLKWDSKISVREMQMADMILDKELWMCGGCRLGAWKGESSRAGLCREHFISPVQLGLNSLLWGWGINQHGSLRRAKLCKERCHNHFFKKGEST